MSTFNYAIAIESKVNATRSTTGIFFVVPAGQYALFQVSNPGGATISVGGRLAVGSGFTHGVYCGPGDDVTYDGGSGTVDITGVLFKNQN